MDEEWQKLSGWSKVKLQTAFNRSNPSNMRHTEFIIFALEIRDIWVVS